MQEVVSSNLIGSSLTSYQERSSVAFFFCSRLAQSPSARDASTAARVSARITGIPGRKTAVSLLLINANQIDEAARARHAPLEYAEVGLIHILVVVKIPTLTIGGGRYRRP